MPRQPLASIEIDANGHRKGLLNDERSSFDDHEECLRAAIAEGKTVTTTAFGDAIESLIEIEMPDKAYNVLQLQWQHYFQTGSEVRLACQSVVRLGHFFSS